MPVVSHGFFLSEQVELCKGGYNHSGKPLVMRNRTVHTNVVPILVNPNQFKHEKQHSDLN